MSLKFKNSRSSAWIRIMNLSNQILDRTKFDQRVKLEYTLEIGQTIQTRIFFALKL